MLVASAILLAITAVGGLAAAGIRVRTRSNPPLPLAVVHGAAGAVGLVLLIAAGINDEFSGAHTTAAVLLVVAALGGFVLVASHLRGRVIALPLVGVHAAVAVGGYVALLVAAAQ